MMNVGFMYNQNLQMCCEQEVWMEHEMMSKQCFEPRADGTTPTDVEIQECLAKVMNMTNEALETCDPEPSCW
jgi:hypothetical protein